MKRCLSERALLQVHNREGTAVQQEHLRLCADCVERYDQLVEDLEALHGVLQAAPPAVEVRRAVPFSIGWVPVAAAAVALLAIVGGVRLLRAPTAPPVQVASRGTAVSAFAADVSAALFADGAPTTTGALATTDAPYLQAALDSGSLCTRDRYFGGECDDQLSALILESE